MNQTILKLAKTYSKANHEEHLFTDGNIMNQLTLIYDNNWENNSQLFPYEVITQLLDCYYALPYRPDLASLFCWQSINYCYNQYLISDPTINRLLDTNGIQKAINQIHSNYNKYKEYLSPYLTNISDKTFIYIASYILKGYAIEKAGFCDKYINSSYFTFKKRFSQFYTVISNSYGYSYSCLCSPSLNGCKVDLNITDADKSRKIVHSLSLKIKKLIEKQKTNIECKIPTSMNIDVCFSDEEIITFLMFNLLYASRCNNFHGNVASRLNSIYANIDSFKMYTNIFLTEYMVLAILLNNQNILSDDNLQKLKLNANLLLK